MMKNEPIVTTSDKLVCHRHHKHLSWSGIIAGAFFAVGLTFLFNLLTTGLGLSLFTRNEHGMAVLTVAGLIWLVLGVYFIFFFAGWATGKIAASNLACTDGSTKHCGSGMLHGFLAWTLYLIVTLLILSHIGEATSMKFYKTSFTSIGSDVDTTTTKIESDTKVSQGAVLENEKAGNLTTRDINKLGWATLITFFIFALGALGACIGACCGASHCQRKDEENLHKHEGYPSSSRPR